MVRKTRKGNKNSFYLMQGDETGIHVYTTTNTLTSSRCHGSKTKDLFSILRTSSSISILVRVFTVSSVYYNVQSLDFLSPSQFHFHWIFSLPSSGDHHWREVHCLCALAIALFAVSRVHAFYFSYMRLG